jgi:hypothetical protein
MGGDLDELAKVAADALVSAMVSGSWDSARHRFAAVVGHEQRMEMAQAELAAAKGEDREREQQAQAQRWTTRLRDVLDDDHRLAVDLRGLLTELGSHAPAAVPTSQHALAHDQSQAVDIGGNVSGNAGDIYTGVSKSKINFALKPFVFVARSARRAAAACPVPATAVAVVAVLAVGTVAGWTARWPPAVFGSSGRTPSWTAAETPLPPGAHPDGAAGGFEEQVIAASCPADGTCLASGNYTDEAGNVHAVVDTVTRGRAAVTASRMPLPPGAAAQSYPLITGITCTAPSQCLAGGSYAGSNQNGLIETLSDGSWTPVRLSLPDDAGRDQQMEIEGLACPAVARCIAVGSDYYENSAGTTTESRALTQALAGGRWAPAEIPLPVNAATTGEVAELEAISCMSTQTCIAVGHYTATHGITQGLIETLANGTWTPLEAPLPHGASAHQNAILWALDCTAAGTCSAVGQYISTRGVSQGLIETLANATWTPARAPLPRDASDQKAAKLYGIACAGANLCAAVGQYTGTDGASQGLIENRTGQTWIPVEAALPRNATLTGQNAALYTVACSATGTCLAGGTTLPVTRPAAGPPSPSPSDSLAATFSDGTQVLVTGGAVDGGTGNGWTEFLEIIAGPDGYPDVGGLLIQAADSSSWEDDAPTAFYYGYAAPGSGDTSEPPLPANPVNQDVPPPAELAPGKSICVQQDFEDLGSSTGDNDGPPDYTVTATLADGAKETVSLPSDGSGPGDACLFTG